MTIINGIWEVVFLFMEIKNTKTLVMHFPVLIEHGTVLYLVMNKDSHEMYKPNIKGQNGRSYYAFVVGITTGTLACDTRLKTAVLQHCRYSLLM